MVDLITSGEAGRLLSVHPATLRKHETPDGRWCIVFGERYRFRVFNYGGGLNPTRRYDRNELLRVVNRMQHSS